MQVPDLRVRCESGCGRPLDPLRKMPQTRPRFPHAVNNTSCLHFLCPGLTAILSAMVEDGAALVGLLTEALTRSGTLVKQIHDQRETIDRLFRECAEKDIEIDGLRRTLKIARTEQSQLSSPVVYEEVEQPPGRIFRSTTPKIAPPRHSSPQTSPQVQVFSSPPKKRQRTETRENTPLREVSNSKPLPRKYDRIQKAIEAIPSIAEDGDWGDGNGGRARREFGAGGRNQAHSRLGALLDAPAPSFNVLTKRPISVSPKAKSATIPSPQRSSSDAAPTELPASKRRLRFMAPKPMQQQYKAPLRLRTLSSLHLSDFVPRSGYIEEWDRPRARNRLTSDADQISDETILCEYLGPGAEEKLANMTKSARDNLLHDARLKRMVSCIDAAQTAPKQGGNGPSYWDMDFPRSQEEEGHRAERKESLLEEVKARYDEAVSAGGRWQFRDEVSVD